MKVRESGMPEEAYWESLFDVPLILDRLGIDARLKDVMELGCGYGTFTLPVARRISGVIEAVDIEPGMIERTRQRAQAAGLRNVRCQLRDVMRDGFGGEPGSRDACLLLQHPALRGAITPADGGGADGASRWLGARRPLAL